MSEKSAARLLLVGCGKMGGALLEGVSSPSLFSAITVVDPAPPPERLKSLKGVTWLSSLDEVNVGYEPDLVTLAVKPQQMAETLPSYVRFKKAVFLSIAAGTSLLRLEELLSGTHYSIVRAMPNLPASIGQGISGLIANKNVHIGQRALCGQFLKTVGDVVWVESENQIDVLTAISANGPAYIFALCEAMAKAGESLGLAPEIAMRLARQTVIGSGALLAQSQESTENLRRAVTSPGGTTEASFKILLGENGLNELMAKAIAAGARRASELAN